jgi:hypothetical protein
MGRFVIYTGRGGNRWRQLQPAIHDDLRIPAAVQRATRYMRDNPSATATAVRLDDATFNLMAADPTDCYEFAFPEG